MKKLFFAAVFAALSFATATAQTVKQDAQGNFYEVKKARKPDTLATLTNKTFTNSKGEKFKVWKSARGKYFVNVTSKNGNQYKKYLN